MQSFLAILLALPAALAAATIDRRQTAATIPDAWIVTLKTDANFSKALSTVGAMTGIKPRRSFNSVAFKGFSFKGPDNGVLDILASIGAVESIEPDQLVAINAPAVQVEKRAKRYITEKGAPWGLTRICRRKNNQTANGYIYDSLYQGDGVNAYVIDTGINLAHQEFEGRAVSGANFVDSSLDANDDNGHGTHVAGTIGGGLVGVAKHVNLIAVKVLAANGTGSVSQVLSGIDWVINDAANKTNTLKSVANLSLGAGYYAPLNQAVSAASQEGIFFAVAAGNENADAANYSPSSTPDACTIAASDRNDTRASFSNYGAVVDLYAPGVDIFSAWIGSSSAYAIASGTSMASPHAAGIAAYLRSAPGNPSLKADALQLCELMKTKATKNVIQDAGTGTVANLLNNGRPNQK